MEYRSSLNEIVLAAHENAVSKGFYDDITALRGYLAKQDQQAMRAAAKRDFVLAQLSKIACEVGEAVQEIQRKGVDAESVADELADVIIRVCDLAGYLDINLGRAVHKKMLYNASRPYKHGKQC